MLIHYLLLSGDPTTFSPIQIKMNKTDLVYEEYLEISHLQYTEYNLSLTLIIEERSDIFVEVNLLNSDFLTTRKSMDFRLFGLPKDTRYSLQVQGKAFLKNCNCTSSGKSPRLEFEGHSELSSSPDFVQFYQRFPYGFFGSLSIDKKDLFQVLYKPK